MEMWRSSGAKIVAIYGIILAVLMQCMAAKTVHVVGDWIGWDIPNGGASLYTNWASTKTFLVGDTLTFNFATGRHDVVEVPKASFDGCSSNDAVQTVTAGPANVTLSAAGEHFFICSFGTHCAAGQKLAVNVSGDSSTASPSRPTTTAHSPTSPAICPPESSPSPVAGGPKSGSSVPSPPAGSSAPAASAASLLSMLSVGLSFFYFFSY